MSKNNRDITELFDQITSMANPSCVRLEYSNKALRPNNPSKNHPTDINFCEISFEKNIPEKKIEKLLELFYDEEICFDRLPALSRSNYRVKSSGKIVNNIYTSLEFRLKPDEAKKLKDYLNDKMDYAFSSTNAIYYPDKPSFP